MISNFVWIGIAIWVICVEGFFIWLRKTGTNSEWYQDKFLAIILGSFVSVMLIMLSWSIYDSFSMKGFGYVILGIIVLAIFFGINKFIDEYWL